MFVVQDALHATIKNPEYFKALWPFLLGELPRYVLFSLIALMLAPFRKWRAASLAASVKGSLERKAPKNYSAVVVGHNEGSSIPRVARALKEQSEPPKEVIVVSDGSNDETPQILQQLCSQGEIGSVHHISSRNGKAAALNLALKNTRHEFVLFIDSDTAADRNAVRDMLQYFDDPDVGAVSGNLSPSCTKKCMMTLIQRIEYGVSLSLGRMVLDDFGMMSCVSGALGMFRRSALEEVKGFNAGSGEDLDATLRLRRAGWKIRFCRTAMASTIAPTTLSHFTDQRMRWDGDSAGIRFCRHWQTLVLGRGNNFWREAWHMLDYLLFFVLPVVAMPFYLLWLFYSHEALFAVMVLLVLLSLQTVADFMLVLLVMITRCAPLTLLDLAVVPAYTSFTFFYYRPLRLIALLHEVLLARSSRNNFVPEHVRKALQK